VALFVVAHEPAPDNRSPQARSLRLAADAARQSGLAVIRLPFPFENPDDALPSRLPGDLAVYSGPIPQFPSHYEVLEQSLAARGARLVNAASASEQASRIEHWHLPLGQLSAQTVILRSPADLDAAGALGFPVFLKGLVKSAKESGFEACLARDRDALEARARGAWAQGQTLAARELVPFKRTGVTTMRFPQAREYRVMLLDHEVLHHQFYWAASDPVGSLSEPDRDEMLGLAERASRLLEARLLVVDAGQLDDNNWRVVEVGDSQHTGLAHIPPHRYWTELKDRL
jgi:hypothetical protein